MSSRMPSSDLQPQLIADVPPALGTRRLVPSQGRPASATLDLPPLAVVWLAANRVDRH